MNSTYKVNVPLDKALVLSDLERRVNSSPELFVSDITAALLGAGIDCYVVGGAVRNWICGERSRDIDIAVTCGIHEAMRAVEPVCAGVELKLIAAFGLTYVRGDVDLVDVTVMRNCDDIIGEIDDTVFKGGATMLQDAQSRDFTFNTFYYGLKDGVVYNPYPTGLEDLRSRTARFIMDPRKTAVDYRIDIRFVQFLSRGYTLCVDGKRVLQEKLEYDVLRFDEFGYWLNVYVPPSEPNYPEFKRLMLEHVRSEAARERLNAWFSEMERP